MGPRWTQAWRFRGGGIGDFGGGSLEEHPRQWLAAQWPGLSFVECRAAQSYQARPEKAQAPSRAPFDRAGICVGLGAPYPPSCAVIDGCPLKSFFMEPASRALNISHVDSDGVCRGWLTWQLIPVHAKRVVIVAELPQRFAYDVRHDLRRIA